MSKLNQLFQNIPELSPAPELEGLVLKRIEFLEEKKAKRAKVWSLSGFALALWSFAYFLGTFGETLVGSEFWSIISLAFSDARIVAANWSDFSYSALETFPLVSVMAMLVPTAILLWSFGKYFEWHNKFNHKLIIN